MTRINIPDYINTIISKLEAANHEAYVVGGCVRDTLLGIEVNDWDICTSALPEQMKSALNDYKLIDTGIKHGTITAICDKDICEITTFRTDGVYTDHRRPDNVSFVSELRSDLSRRDFTVNAMAYSHRTGIIDLFDGQKDLCNNILRCVGVPKERFNEDALRIVRALRFSACLGFEIEKDTADAVNEELHLIDFIAKERIAVELKKLICGSYAHLVISKFPAVFNKVFSGNDISQNAFLLKDCKKGYSYNLALLLKDIKSENVRKILKALKFDNRTITEVCFLVEMQNIKLASERIHIRKLMSDFGKEKALLLAEFDKTLNLISDSEFSEIKEIIESEEVITLKNLDIDGNDIISMGVPAGKEVSKYLSEALTAVIDNRCNNNKKEIISYLKSIF